MIKNTQNDQKMIKNDQVTQNDKNNILFHIRTRFQTDDFWVFGPLFIRNYRHLHFMKKYKILCRLFTLYFKGVSGFKGFKGFTRPGFGYQAIHTFLNDRGWKMMKNDENNEKQWKTVENDTFWWKFIP